MAPRKPPCGNPLWLSWVTELRDEAQAKGKKSYDAYQRACASIEACPVPYARPRDLICLRGVGDKTIKIIEGRWEKWLLDHPEAAQDRGPLVGPSMTSNAQASSSNVTAKPRGKAQSKAQLAKTGLLSGSEDDELAPGAVAVSPQPAKRRRKVAQYIPARQSGGYGILMALVLAIDEPWRTTTVFQTRDEIVRVAQKWCSSSYDKGEKNAWMTAWNSIKTLVSKGYVYERGRPANFCLTEEGYNVAISIRNMDLPGAADQPQYPYLETDDPDSHARYPSTRPLADEDDDSDLGVVPATSLPFPQAVVKRTQVNPLEALNNSAGRSESLGGRAGLDAHTIGLSVSREVPKPTSSAGKFGFWYLDAAGARVQMMSDAFIKLDPETFTILRKLSFEPVQITHPFVKQLKDVKLEGDVYIGFISEECAPPKCSGFLQGTSSVTTIAAKASGYQDHMSTSLAAGPSSEFSRTASAPLPPRAGSSRAAAAMTAEARKLPVSLSRSTSASAAVPALPRTSGPRMTAHPEAPSALFQYDPTIAAPTPSHQPLAQSDFSPDKAIIFPPGSYEIVLVLDSRENENFFGRERCSDLLRARGVEVDVRALRIGDMCWVARRIDGGVGGENDECVLDYVVERKRLDDLLSSLTDGRYHEQKFRLAQSCISHVYYIVEDWHKISSGKSDRLGHAQINTAKSQTSITDGFFVKETHKFTETLDYLATLSEIITETCQGQALHVIPSRYVSRATYPALQARLRASDPDTAFLTTYDAFQQLNDKTASRTLKERFGRMLLCVKGLSAEKVGAMLEKWDTPIALYESLKRRVEEEPEEVPTGKKHRGPELYFADQFAGEGRRKIGDALSRELYNVFMG